MKIGFVISFYNEEDVVANSINSILNLDSSATIITVHSGGEFRSDKNRQLIRLYSTYRSLPNLGEQLDSFSLPAAAVCRNYSVGFKELRKIDGEFDWTICLLGDTLLKDPVAMMESLKKKVMRAGILQAIGQEFHAKESNPPAGIYGGRPQSNDTKDFMPQFFCLRGEWPEEAFTNIEVYNPWTTEENLGRELDRWVDWSADVVRLNVNPLDAYSFYDGVRLQYVV